ncbi:MAG: phage integrase SAM-like domain-containing protein [Acidimicrobiales bacterium]
MWHGSLNFGVGASGKRLRRHVRGKTQGEVRRKLDLLKRDREVGIRVGVTATKSPTVGDWTSTWIEIVERTRRPSTAKTYRTHIKYLDPLARVRLDRLTSELIESVYIGLVGRGVDPVSVQGAHRTYHSCLGEAVKRGWLARNPVTAARPSTADEREILPLSLDEARAILAAATGRRNAVKWDIALGLGLRQGEVLGLQWADIDIEDGTLHVRRALQQGRWRHGCRHPDRCRPRPQDCPLRHGGGLIVGPPKSRRGDRTIVLPGPLRNDLRGHRSAQAAERLAAGELGAPPTDPGARQAWSCFHGGRLPGAVGDES